MGKTFLFLCILSLCSHDPALANNIRRIAVIDTEFCVANIRIPLQLKNRIIINPLTNSTRDCGKSTPQERWAHGHHVLKIFIQELSHRLPDGLVVEIYPYTVFTSDGTYTLKKWQEMLATLMGISPDVIIMASTYYGPGHATLEQSVKNFHAIFLLSAGARDETIKDPNFLWPQSSKLVQKILFGTYIQRRVIELWLDQNPLVKEIYYFKESMHRFYRIKGKNFARKVLIKITDQMALSKIPELKSLRMTLHRWREEIVNFFENGLTNGRTEGFNRVGKLIQRNAYGFRNFENYRRRLIYKTS